MSDPLTCGGGQVARMRISAPAPEARTSHEPGANRTIHSNRSTPNRLFFPHFFFCC